MSHLSLSFLVAREHNRELLAAAARERLASVGDAASTGVTLRLASAGDADRIRRLAELDSAPVPRGAALVAEIDGRIQAALPLDGGEPIANPFKRSADIVQLLQIRASQLELAA